MYVVNLLVQQIHYKKNMSSCGQTQIGKNRRISVGFTWNSTKKPWKQMEIVVGQQMRRSLHGPSRRKTNATFVGQANVKVTQLRRLLRGPNGHIFLCVGLADEGENK